MKTKKTFTLNKWFLPTSLFVIFMSLVYSCDTSSGEYCDEDDSICEELVTACTNDYEEYYVLEGDTIKCAGIDDCGAAEDELLRKCTIASQDNGDLNLKFQSLMNSVRLLK